MTANNRERIDTALQLLAQGLYPYIEEEMKAVYSQNWFNTAKSSLPDHTIPNKKKLEEVLTEDVSLTLQLILKQWDEVFKKKLDKSDKAIVEELREVRNNWAHQSPFSTEDTYRALDSITRLLKAISASEADEVEKKKQEVFKILYSEQNPSETRPTSSASPEEKNLIETFQEIREKIPFKDASLLQVALTHRSYLYENPKEVSEDNNRLEFLGDALLGFISAEYLYNRYPKMKESQMTPLRSKLVENSILAKFAGDLNLCKLILLSRGEEAQGGREKESLLSGTLEAIIGAYVLDSGIEAVRDFLEPLFDDIVENIDVFSESDLEFQISENPKGCFQEWALQNYKTAPRYDTVQMGGLAHAPEFFSTVFVGDKEFGEGTGSSKKEAEKRAAQNALANIEQTRLE